MIRTHRTRIPTAAALALLAVLFGLAACVPTEGPGTQPPESGAAETPTEAAESPTAPPPTPLAPTPTSGTPQIVTGEAPVDSVTLDILSEDPLEVEAVVSGSLPDACTEIARFAQAVREMTIQVGIFTARPADVDCAQVLTPYEERIPLELADLPDGEYTIRVNGVAADALLTVGEPDEALPTPTSAPSQANCPSPSRSQVAVVEAALGLCFTYPGNAGADIVRPAEGIIQVVGQPDKEQGPAILTIAVVSAEEQSLDELLGEVIATAEEEEIGGQPGLLLPEGIDGDGTTLAAVALAYDQFFVLVASPLDPEQPEASALAERLWKAVLDSLVLFPPQQVVSDSGGGGGTVVYPPARQEQEVTLEDLGMLFTLPARWQLDRLRVGYGLIGPDYEDYAITIGPLRGLRYDDLASLEKALAQMLADEGEEDFVIEAGGLKGIEALRIRGLSDACLLYVIPSDGLARGLVISTEACDENGELADPAIKIVLESLALFEPGM